MRKAHQPVIARYRHLPAGTNPIRRWACVLLIVVAPGIGVGYGQSSDMERLRPYSLELVNAARKERDLPPLELDQTLNQSAQAHADDMLDKGYFAHTSPEGEDVMDRYRAAGGKEWRLVSENIGHCPHCQPPPTEAEIQRQHEGWMQSPEHRHNILGEGLTHYGLGVAVGTGGLYAVQNFSGPGEPRGLAEGEGAVPIALDQISPLAADIINEARQDEGLSPLEPDPGLAGAAQDLVPAGLAGFDLNEISSPYQALAAGQQREWRRLQVLAGSCGGCGAEPTEADIRFFIGGWLDQPQYKDLLLDPAMVGLGLVLRANGDGRKVAVAIIGAR